MPLAAVAVAAAVPTTPAAPAAPAAVPPTPATAAIVLPALPKIDKQALSVTAPKAVVKEARDGKPQPSATPQEVAARISEKLAMLRADRAERNMQEMRVRAHSPAVTPPRKKTAPADSPVSTTGTLLAAHAPKTGHAKHRETDWSYGGEGGPVRWAEMNPEWAKCGNGNRQSPIDIRSGIKLDLEPVQFDYKPTGFSIIDTGHTIQVNLGAGNQITVSGRMYELVQFHFHRPSEEKINGRAYDMVAHLVHKDAAGKLAVVAVLIERGAARNLVQTVWNNLPLEKNELVSPPGALDMNHILPARREYFTYMGSMTTPPCSEGVLWMVMKEPVSVSQDQIDIFARLYQMNARPIQVTSERMIKESN